jgi:hypothetical protein
MESGHPSLCPFLIADILRRLLDTIIILVDATRDGGHQTTRKKKITRKNVVKGGRGEVMMTETVSGLPYERRAISPFTVSYFLLLFRHLS